MSAKVKTARKNRNIRFEKRGFRVPRGEKKAKVARPLRERGVGRENT